MYYGTLMGIMTEQFCGIPAVFHQFTGYNKPERSKHRKREVSSLAGDILHSHSQRLFSNLQSGFGIIHSGSLSSKKWSCWLKDFKNTALLYNHLRKFIEQILQKMTDLRSREVKKALFYASVQHAKNSGMMLRCDECGMWRLIYASRKLKAQEKQLFEHVLDGLCFSCGSLLQDAELPEGLQDVVFVRSMNCVEPIEALYYSANYVDICVYCSADLPLTI